ncbi:MULTISPECIES: hypothetical protein [Flagellimonas]|uniref:Uncharacterized protein n=1 Tax=Flagellimonas hadalis TaxID=2597517 RepID=A0A5N5IW00_9FLAO|nr:hypothetical protein [Allomuricauda hadalis]KAB5490067.1 hypothetical protein FOT42_006875 [Allomuricauda hadalis]
MSYTKIDPTKRFFSRLKLWIIVPISLFFFLNAAMAPKKELPLPMDSAPLPYVDTDGDGISDDIDEDDDNDGIPDLFEDGCEINTAFGTPPATVPTTNYVTSIYTNYNGFWSSSAGSINPQSYDNVSTLLAFTVGSKTYATGVNSTAMIDSDSNGLFDLMDTDGNGTGDISVEETSWTALRPVTKIKSGIRLEGRAIDGNTSSAVGPLLTTGGIPFNPYLYEGERGLDMSYAIANIGNAWYFRLGGTNTPAYGDGQVDILLTQGAQLGSGSNYNRLHLLDEDGNYLGNGVEINWNTTPIVGNSIVDQYNVNDSPNASNSKKNIRLAGVELAEFGLTPAERARAVIFRLEISANADPIFFVVNDNSFITTCTPLDTDGDGLANSIDLDSDNDGILDAVEAGHGQTLVAGRVPGAVGTDGIPNAVQAPSQYDNGTINYEILDSNNDNILDYVSTDSDADGCNDVMEAGFTDGDNDGFLGTSPVSIDAWGVVTGQGGYTAPHDGDGNGIFDYREAGDSPGILAAPSNMVIFDGQSGNIAITVDDTTSFQWQLSTDNGLTFSDLSDSATYSGTDTATLTINNVGMEMEGYRYRLVLFNDAYVCDPSAISDAITLDVRVASMITNRKITFRVDKEGS